MSFSMNRVVAPSLLKKDLAQLAGAVCRWMVDSYQTEARVRTVTSENLLLNQFTASESKYEIVSEGAAALISLRDRHGDKVYSVHQIEESVQRLKQNVQKLEELHSRLAFMMIELQGLVRRSH